jgi:4-amino-4-deoxy-L-arabinose transferase-like glycosyltransferase
MLMIAIPIFRTASIMLMSSMPVLLFGLLLICCWINWNRTRRLHWALSIGIFAGWAAISRPIEAISMATPIAIAMLFRMRDLKWSIRLATVSLVILGAAPFLTLQLIVNRGVSGRITESPWEFYCRRDFPQAALGFAEFDPSIRPQSPLRQKQKHYENFMPNNATHRTPYLTFIQWTGWRGQILASSTLPHTILLIFVPLGVEACRARWRWIVAGSLPIFVLLYSLSIFFQEYYPIVMIPAVLLLVILGVHVLSGSIARHSSFIRAALLLWLALLAVSALPEARPRHKDQFFEPRLLRHIDNWERKYTGNRAIVLHRFSERRNLNEEPVYNTATAWPDDAWIIRAHDLGDNTKLFDYYGRIQPDRDVFLFNQADRSMTRLGTVGDLRDAAKAAGYIKTK